jgi:glycosyltransferase involved in cell wall biosynthesis
MHRPDHRRVALFHCNWAVQSQTANALIMLADAGYDVELFLYNRPRAQDYVNFEELQRRTNVRIHQLWAAEPEPSRPSNGSSTPPRRFRSLLRSTFPVLAQTRSSLKHAYHRHTLRRGMAQGLLASGLVERTLSLMAGKQYRCLIGVEKKGLVWAGLVAQRLGIPYFYYSLELYTDEGDYWRIILDDRFAWECMWLGERLHHAKAAATIIQDFDRAQVLFRDTGVDLSKATVHYVPVSVLGEPYPKRTGYLRETLGIPSDHKLILYFGQIWEGRYVVELAEVAQRFPDDWRLVLHGEPMGSVVEKIKQVDKRGKVVLSLQMVPSEQVPEVIASADVGLLFYSGRSHNERLTAFASEKMALYMQCGVPFIAFDHCGFKRLAEEEGCGVVVQRLEELPEAVDKILRNPETFRASAQRSFAQHYNFANNFAPVVKAIEAL